MRSWWTDKTRMAAAALLYVVGVASMIFVAYRDRSVPGFVVGYWPLFAGGMVLVAVAALVWPIRREGGSEVPNTRDSD